MSYHVRCTRCASMVEAEWNANGPRLPDDWGGIALTMGNGDAWDSEYNDAHLCGVCLTELTDFLRGCKVMYEGNRGT